MNPRLIPVDPANNCHVTTLYLLLGERTPDQAISHQRMPSYEQHERFVKSKPYKCWYIVEVDVDVDYLGTLPVHAGAVYLTHNNEIGIFIFQHFKGRGMGKFAVQEIMKLYPGPFLANINPKNYDSQQFFSDLGFKICQVTYRHE